MRYPASEKAEIIQLVAQSHLSAADAGQAWCVRHSTDGMISTARPALMRWPTIGHDQTGSGIAFPTRGQIIDLALEFPELAPRELAVRFTDLLL